MISCGDYLELNWHQKEKSCRWISSDYFLTLSFSGYLFCVSYQTCVLHRIAFLGGSVLDNKVSSWCLWFIISVQWNHNFFFKMLHLLSLFHPPPKHPPHTYTLRVSAGSTPALPSQGAVEGLQPHGTTRGQRLPRSHSPVLLHSDSSHGCGTTFRHLLTTTSLTIS